MWGITVVTIISALLLLNVALAQSPINLELTQSSCQTKTQVDSSVLQKVRTGDYSSDDKKLHAYAFCIYRSLGIIDDAANVNAAAVTAIATDHLNKDKLQKAVETCSKVTGSDPNEKAFKICKCFHEQFPEDESDL